MAGVEERPPRPSRGARLVKPSKKIQKKLEARLKGHAQMAEASKTGGKEYTMPGSRNPKKQA